MTIKRINEIKYEINKIIKKIHISKFSWGMSNPICRVEATAFYTGFLL